MKKVLFIDRDGTILREPLDEQVDSLEDFEFIPGVITALSAIAIETDYEFVMVTNQDGLGTDSFPEDTFWPSHNKMLQILEGEGVKFADVFIDRTFPEDKAPTRKPGTAMLTKYISQGIDMASSYVIGDRITDLQLAENLGCRAIYFSNEINSLAALSTRDWKEIYRFLKSFPRKASVDRNTSETRIKLRLNLDGTGEYNVNTGIGFFDHMLAQLARHGGFDLSLEARGDLDVDFHHTVEDVAISLGEAFVGALGSKKGIERYGFVLPMDDCLAQVAIDFSGRPWLVWDVKFNSQKTGEMPTEMFFHFFKSFSDSARCNLNIRAEGDNDHHKAEAVFKAFARSMKLAAAKTDSGILPTTKGKL
ncbi:MAG: bifunctional histidinol-phosphatase/imidazoleglycerol-phosphate dehydratase HisB [Bacteroidales bacterium]|jgi:imidazoleglycerol-phosphate dehydratase/histidinol-phosphatase|nr:bifunctional histidinol-phosphatase/imidazoleglycerol-phosphate dehydratase HisB [Bacteroidales bacterium]